MEMSIMASQLTIAGDIIKNEDKTPFDHQIASNWTANYCEDHLDCQEVTTHDQVQSENESDETPESLTDLDRPLDTNSNSVCLQPPDVDCVV
ncbi:hypothetical protein ACOMHN_032714 [Nucella lapillus]